MAYQFNSFRASKPVVRLIDPVNMVYEVFFVLYDETGKKHFMRYKAGINSLPKSERKTQAHAMAVVLWEALQDNWHPLREKYPNFNKPRPVIQNMLLPDALEYALKQKKNTLSKFSFPDYRGCVRFMNAAAKNSGHYYVAVQEMSRADIRAIVLQAREQHNWSNKARNKYLTIFKALLSVLVDEDILKFNPAAGMKNDPEEQTLGYKRLTDDQKELIAEHLLLKAPDFFEYLMFIYDDGIRRKETLLLQVRDINLQAQEITIRPEVAKTNRARIVPITDTLMQILISRQIWELPADYYIFSRNKFKPGPEPYHPNVPTGWWYKLVQEELKIDCKMYSLKHKGADDKILANVELDALRNLYGHRSQQMTEGYARAVKGKYKQQIIDRAPAFAKVVEMRKKVQ